MTGSVRITFSCFACGRIFEMGPSHYDGMFIARYGIKVCRECFDNNADGWGPFVERRLLAHLKDNDMATPARNANGWLPRD